jgi:hypothetical protein
VTSVERGPSDVGGDTLRNDLELTVAAFYEAPADFTNPGTTVDTAAGPLTGTLTARTSRWGALLGARWVHGLVWRWFVGAEIGWSRQSFTELDLIDVSDPSNPQSFGLGLAPTAAKGHSCCRPSPASSGSSRTTGA